MAWLRVILMGIFGKVAAKFAAPLAVLFVDRREHPVWGVRDATDLSWWNTGIRNGAHNMFNRPMPEFTSVGEIDESVPGVQTRWRKSVDGQYVSYRRVWGKVRPKKGKHEFYIGWTMNEKAYMRLTFFQLR